MKNNNIFLRTPSTLLMKYCLEKKMFLPWKIIKINKFSYRNHTERLPCIWKHKRLELFGVKNLLKKFHY